MARIGKWPATCGGNVSFSRGGSSTHIRATKEEFYTGATSPLDYNINITHHFELDVHKLFTKHSGVWFKDILHEKKWDARFGNLEWFFHLELVNKFGNIVHFGEGFINLPLTMILKWSYTCY